MKFAFLYPVGTFMYMKSLSHLIIVALLSTTFVQPIKSDIDFLKVACAGGAALLTGLGVAAAYDYFKQPNDPKNLQNAQSALKNTHHTYEKFNSDIEYCIDLTRDNLTEHYIHAYIQSQNPSLLAVAYALDRAHQSLTGNINDLQTQLHTIKQRIAQIPTELAKKPERRHFLSEYKALKRHIQHALVNGQQAQENINLFKSIIKQYPEYHIEQFSHELQSVCTTLKEHKKTCKHIAQQHTDELQWSISLGFDVYWVNSLVKNRYGSTWYPFISYTGALDSAITRINIEIACLNTLTHSIARTMHELHTNTLVPLHIKATLFPEFHTAKKKAKRLKQQYEMTSSSLKSLRAWIHSLELYQRELQRQRNYYAHKAQKQVVHHYVTHTDTTPRVQQRNARSNYIKKAFFESFNLFE